MGRKSLDDKKTESDIDRKRKNAIEKFFGLTDKVLKHIEWSIVATKVCMSCTQMNDGSIKPGKAKDETGLCAMCHGSNLVPDVQQRNWATQEIADRIAPKPKAVEMTVDKKDTGEIEQQLSQMPKQEVDRLAKELGVVFDEKMSVM